MQNEDRLVTGSEDPPGAHKSDWNSILAGLAAWLDAIGARRSDGTSPSLDCSTSTCNNGIKTKQVTPAENQDLSDIASLYRLTKLEDEESRGGCVFKNSVASLGDP